MSNKCPVSRVSHHDQAFVAKRLPRTNSRSLVREQQITLVSILVFCFFAFCSFTTSTVATAWNSDTAVNSRPREHSRERKGHQRLTSECYNEITVSKHSSSQPFPTRPKQFIIILARKSFTLSSAWHGSPWLSASYTGHSYWVVSS